MLFLHPPLTTSSHVSFCCCYFDITSKPFENIIRFLLRCSHRTHKIYLCFFQLNFITISLLFACISLLTMLLLPSFRMLNIFWIHKPCFHCAAIISSLAAALGWKQSRKKESVLCLVKRVFSIVQLGENVGGRATHNSQAYKNASIFLHLTSRSEIHFIEARVEVEERATISTRFRFGIWRKQKNKNCC